MRIFKLALLAAPLFLIACQTPKEAAIETPMETAIEPLPEVASESIAISEPAAPTEDNAVSPIIDPAAPRYGYTEENPILVGAEVVDGGPGRERAYLDSLTGPDGQKISYARLGSCCPFETSMSPFGGLLDMYEVMHEGLDEPVMLYLNMYDPGETHAPEGFKVQN